MAHWRQAPLSPRHGSGVQAVPAIRARDPGVFATITRRKNGNVVVYRANVSPQGGIDGIDTFWLDLEPSYRAAARAQGRAHDRDEFTFLDRIYYGTHTSLGKPPGVTATVCLKKVPEYPLTLRLMADRIHVHAYVTLKSQMCRLEGIYVHDNGPLSPDYIELVGLNTQRERVTVRIVP
jgi:hypothetical protein